MTEMKEMDASALKAMIERIEGKLRSGSSAGEEFMLKGELLNKQSQLGEMHQRQELARSITKEEKARETAAAAYIVERESKLNTEEKKQYSELLQPEYFSKSDVNKLNQFYAQAWDKLSNDGKAEISERLWKGINKDEIKLEDLSPEAQEKEKKFLYDRITGKVTTDKPMWNIPEQDRKDFLRAYEAQDEKAANEVLQRKSFSQHAEKSASMEADSTKEKKIDEKSDFENAKKDSITIDRTTWAFNEDTTPVKPTDIRGNNGGIRVPS